MSRRDINIMSNDGIHKLHVIIWEPENEVKGVLQISHGMIEMIERYDDFAKYMNQKGYAVIGNDHLGHGLTAGREDDLGYFCSENMSATMVEDLHSVTLYAKKIYPDVPYYLLGHSMGSFLARRYLMTYGNEPDRAIICGTGSQNNCLLILGDIVTKLIKVVKGDRYRSSFVEKYFFKGFNSRFEPARTKNDWLTKDEAVVDWYNANPYCTFSFTINGYRMIFELLLFIQNKANIAKIPNNLPIFLIAGKDDPVGHYGADIKNIYMQYKKAGVRDIACKLYKNDRHEILNELDKEKVYADIAEWIES